MGPDGLEEVLGERGVGVLSGRGLGDGRLVRVRVRDIHRNPRGGSEAGMKGRGRSENERPTDI